jgi:hypothetical protein
MCKFFPEDFFDGCGAQNRNHMMIVGVKYYGSANSKRNTNNNLHSYVLGSLEPVFLMRVRRTVIFNKTQRFFLISFIVKK